MKTIRLSLLGLASLAALSVSLLRATDPSRPATTGKVLLLRNERIMEGDIERVGERYRVRRQAGETWVPAEGVLCVCASLADAYVYLQARSNLQDPDERLRLAGWCLRNGLRPQALAEVKAAVDLRPDHPESRRLLRHLEQASQAPAAPPPAAAPPEPAADPEPPVELTTEAIGQFATRVQPILMNACASCHAVGRGGSFRLKRTYDVGSDRKTMQQNLAAVLRQVRVAAPESSPLLTKAVCDHGHTGQPPMRSRKDAPYRALEDWVKQTVANNPQLRDRQPMPSRIEDRGSRIEDRKSAAPSLETQWGADTHPASRTEDRGSRIEDRKGAILDPRSSILDPRSPAAAGPPDPYDPDVFNRQTHPEPTKSAPDR